MEHLSGEKHGIKSKFRVVLWGSGCELKNWATQLDSDRSALLKTVLCRRVTLPLTNVKECLTLQFNH